jgi:hypothetical protein
MNQVLWDQKLKTLLYKVLCPESDLPRLPVVSTLAKESKSAINITLALSLDLTSLDFSLRGFVTGAIYMPTICIETLITQSMQQAYEGILSSIWKIVEMFNIIHSVHYLFYVYCPTNVHFYLVSVI